MFAPYKILKFIFRFGTKGNVVGCGINFETREVFFTLNGEFLGQFTL